VPNSPDAAGPIAATIAFLIGNYMTTLFVVGLIVAAVRILRRRDNRSPVAVSGTFLNTFVFWAIGCAQVVNFIMHSVFGDYAAKTIGWAQSPFQLELALSSLGVGVMAFLLYSDRSAFRGKVALVIATVIFGWGAALGHVYQMLVDRQCVVHRGPGRGPRRPELGEQDETSVSIAGARWWLHVRAARLEPGASDRGCPPDPRRRQCALPGTGRSRPRRPARSAAHSPTAPATPPAGSRSR
jgi:hypothetical protein